MRFGHEYVQLETLVFDGWAPALARRSSSLSGLATYTNGVPRRWEFLNDRQAHSLVDTRKSDSDSPLVTRSPKTIEASPPVGRVEQALMSRRWIPRPLGRERGHAGRHLELRYLLKVAGLYVTGNACLNPGQRRWPRHWLTPCPSHRDPSRHGPRLSNEQGRLTNMSTTTTSGQPRPQFPVRRCDGQGDPGPARAHHTTQGAPLPDSLGGQGCGMRPTCLGGVEHVALGSMRACAQVETKPWWASCEKFTRGHRQHLLFGRRNYRFSCFVLAVRPSLDHFLVWTSES